MPREVLFAVYEAKRKASRSSLVYCGNDKSGKAVTAELIRDVVSTPWTPDSYGSLVIPEPFTLLVAQLAYEEKGGAELAYRFERLGK